MRDGRAAVAAREGEGASDAARLRQASTGDAEAVRWLLDSVGPVVYGFVYARVGGDEAVAADLLQETLLEVLRSASTFRGDSSVATWACAIARHRVARHFERERRAEVARRGLVVVRGSEEEVAGPAWTDEVEQRDLVVRALGTLSPLHRQVLILKYLDGRSVGDIASEIGKGRVQVQSLLQRARDGLRRALKAEPDA